MLVCHTGITVTLNESPESVVTVEYGCQAGSGSRMPPRTVSHKPAAAITSASHCSSVNGPPNGFSESWSRTNSTANRTSP